MISKRDRLAREVGSVIDKVSKARQFLTVSDHVGSSRATVPRCIYGYFAKRLFLTAEHTFVIRKVMSRGGSVQINVRITAQCTCMCCVSLCQTGRRGYDRAVAMLTNCITYLNSILVTVGKGYRNVSLIVNLYCLNANTLVTLISLLACGRNTRVSFAYPPVSITANEGGKTCITLRTDSTGITLVALVALVALIAFISLRSLLTFKGSKPFGNR